MESLSTSSPNWVEYIKHYGIPSIAKEKVLKPFFDREFEAPILDLGCGKGYFSHLLSERGLQVVGVDVNSVLENQDNFQFVKSDLLLFVPDRKFKTVFLLNVLTTIPKDKRLTVFKKIKECIDINGSAVILVMNPSLYRTGFNSTYLKVKKTNGNVGELDFTLTDNAHRVIQDFVVTSEEITELSKDAGLCVDKKVKLGFEGDMPIYDVYTLAPNAEN